jgi:hypothetical protein
VKTWSRLQLSSLILFVVATMVMAGCKSREDILYAYGTLAFVIFILLALSSITLHHWHNLPWFQQTRVRSYKLVLPLSYIAIPVGAIVALVSLRSEGVMRLGVFIGVLISVLFHCLQQWGKTESLEKQRLYIKIVQLSASFLIVLVYLSLGGKGLK